MRVGGNDLPDDEISALAGAIESHAKRRRAGLADGTAIGPPSVWRINPDRLADRLDRLREGEGDRAAGFIGRDQVGVGEGGNRRQRRQR
jgi:hypothetical protein